MAHKMDKNEFVEKVSELPGVGKAKAEALWDAGYRSIEDLRASSAVELREKVAGVGPKLADAIVKGIAELGTEGGDTEIEVVETLADKGKKEAAAEIVEEEEHVARAKPELTPEERASLKLRNWMADRRPVFVRRNWWQWHKLTVHSWRRSHGELAKQRRNFKHVPERVKVGFRGPALTRGLHRSGFGEVLVHNPAGLVGIDPKRQAARIANGVGTRKRKLILQEAQDKGIRVLNPGGISK